MLFGISNFDINVQNCKTIEKEDTFFKKIKCVCCEYVFVLESQKISNILPKWDTHVTEIFTTRKNANSHAHNVSRISFLFFLSIC